MSKDVSVYKIFRSIGIININRVGAGKFGSLKDRNKFNEN
jgi:hypothetical protein